MLVALENFLEIIENNKSAKQIKQETNFATLLAGYFYYLVSSDVKDALGGIGAIAGIGNPSVGLAANVLGSFF